MGALLFGSASAGTDGSFSIFYGSKFLSDDWGEANTQDEFGFALAIGGETWPVLVVLERIITADLGLLDVETTEEFSLGLRRTWKVGEERRFRPFLSGGLAHASGFVGAGIGNTVVSEDDGAMGFYLDGGLQFEIVDHVQLLGEVRYSHAEGDSAPLGGTHVAGGLGYCW
jgi:opacity protein-like surface antigen